MKIFKYLYFLLYPEGSLKEYLISYSSTQKIFENDSITFYKFMDMDLHLLPQLSGYFRIALRNSSIKIIEYLLENKNHNLLSLDDDIRDMIFKKGVAFCKKLCGVGYPFTSSDLKRAFYANNFKICKYLIFLGINPDVELLNSILYQNNLEAISFLIKSGVKPNSTTHRIIKIYHLENVKKYLDTIN